MMITSKKQINRIKSKKPSNQYTRTWPGIARFYCTQVERPDAHLAGAHEPIFMGRLEALHS